MPETRMRKIIRELAELDPDTPTFVEDVREIQTAAKAFIESREHPHDRKKMLEHAREIASQKRKEKARQMRAEIRPVIGKLRLQGYDTYRKLAKRLDELGYKPPFSDSWAPNSVRMIEIYEEDSSP